MLAASFCLAAYAFKCLIRCGPLELKDIPKDVLDRTEEIKSLPFGCFVDTISLGKFIRNYFETPQCVSSSETDLSRRD